jgi:hypothetical protein
MQAPTDLGTDAPCRGRANLLEFGLDLTHGATGRRAQEIGYIATGPHERDQRPQIMRVRDPPERASILREPGAVSRPRRRVRYRTCGLDDLAHGGDREPATEQVDD